MNQEHPIKKIPKALWPDLLSDMAEIVGKEAALTLFIKLSGRRFRFPIKPNATHLVAQAIGLEKAELLCKHYQAEFISIPKCAVVLRRVRNTSIISDRRSGMSTSDLATKYDLTYRQIQKIVNGN